MLNKTFSICGVILILTKFLLFFVKFNLLTNNTRYMIILTLKNAFLGKRILER